MTHTQTGLSQPTGKQLCNSIYINVGPFVLKFPLMFWRHEHKQWNAYVWVLDKAISHSLIIPFINLVVDIVHIKNAKVLQVTYTTTE